MMFVSKLATVAVLMYFADCAVGKWITISPNCTQKDVGCHDISKLYIDNSDSLELPSNSTIEFLRSEHSMVSDIVIRDVENLTLQFEKSSRVNCIERAELVFMNITNLQIFGLKMVNCGAEINDSLAHEALYIQTQTVLTIERGLQAAIFAVNIREFRMDHAVINGSHGYGFLGINIIGNSFVANTLINSSNTNSRTEYCLTQAHRLSVSEASKCLGGNALFVYNDYPECPDISLLYTLTVLNSTFSHGLDPIGGFQNYISRGCGFGVTMSQKFYDVAVKLINSTFTNNTARSFGSNLYLRLIITETSSSVEIQRCRVIFGRDGAIKGAPDASLVFLHGLYETSLGNYKNCSDFQDEKDRAYLENDKPRRQILLIEDSVFYSNTGKAIYIASFTSLLHVRHTYTVLIRNCNISENVASRGSALFVLDISSERTNLLDITVENSVMKAHTTFSEAYFGIQSSIILISSVKQFTFRNCVFVDNNNTALLLYESNVYFEGLNIFKNNTARYGAALYLAGNSIVYLRPDAQVFFDSNTAWERGGAIYIAEGNELGDFFDCKIQVFDPSFMNTSNLNIVVKFMNNTAEEAGDALYGGEIDSCFSLAPSQFLYYNQTLKGTYIFDTITDLSSQPPSTSCISSDAKKICFCFDDVHDCSVKNLTVFKYPGEEFSITVIGVGQREGTVPAVVQTQDNRVRKTGNSCTNASFRVQSLNSIEKLNLTASSAQANSFSTLLVTVKLLECEQLVGFSLDNEERVCDCELTLKERGMSCNIDSRVITRHPPYWLSNHSNHLLLHDNCPYDYCKPGQVEIVMTEPNISDQCGFNRYGTLCGSCREGFSLIFGSSECRKCSNRYLSLLIPFALAGVTLVIFLFAFNLTVSVGTINGLIFYANIVKIDETIFFPPGDNSFFRAFISWLNLDLGIETCFYSGMDSLGKTWLQFSFPFYLWAIVLFIIVILHYSTRLTKLCGNHSVPVLATVFLLSFTKLLSTITKVFSFTTLDYPSGRRAVWLYDGNIWYASGGHLVLFLFSLLFLLAVAIPYTFLILTVQILRKYSDKKVLHWVDKSMPIFDAYLGPYKNRQGYWTGLLLLVRVILVAAFTANVFGNSAIDIFVMLVVTIFLILLNLGQGGVYKKNLLTALELSYIVNLGLLAAATALVRQIYGRPRRSVIYTSSTVALVTFAGTLVCHMKKQVMGWCKVGKNMAKFSLKKQKGYERLDGSGGDGRHRNHVSTTVIEISGNNH